MPQDHRSKLTEMAARTFLAMALMPSTANLPAQVARKAITNPAPPYPEVAKKSRLTGIVKVQVVIAADGHIKSVRPIGGHPLLVDSVKETLKDWKYAPASAKQRPCWSSTSTPKLAWLVETHPNAPADA